MYVNPKISVVTFKERDSIAEKRGWDRVFRGASHSLGSAARERKEIRTSARIGIARRHITTNREEASNCGRVKCACSYRERKW
jgi:hypothetical protein